MKRILKWAGVTLFAGLVLAAVVVVTTNRWAPRPPALTWTAEDVASPAFRGSFSEWMSRVAYAEMVAWLEHRSELEAILLGTASTVARLLKDGIVLLLLMWICSIFITALVVVVAINAGALSHRAVVRRDRRIADLERQVSTLRDEKAWLVETATYLANRELEVVASKVRRERTQAQIRRRAG